MASLLSPAQLSSPHGGSGGPGQGVILSHTHDSSTPNVHRQGVGLCTPPHTRVGGVATRRPGSGSKEVCTNGPPQSEGNNYMNPLHFTKYTNSTTEGYTVKHVTCLKSRGGLLTHAIV